MNNKPYLVLTILIFATQVIPAQSLFKGKIICNNEPVDFAYIMNNETKYAVESTDGGIVKLMASENDTLIFRCLGYRDTSFVINKDMLNNENYLLEVSKQEYALDEVKVVWFYSYESFKQAFLNLKLDAPYKLKLPPIDMNEVLKDRYFAKENPSLGITFYLSSAQRTENALNNHEKRWARYNNLTSKENLASFTGLQGDSLNSFILYLRSRPNINPDLTDYEIMASVKVAYENFIALNYQLQDSL